MDVPVTPSAPSGPCGAMPPPRCPRRVLERILRAGRRAQSSKNTQPWQFILVRDAERCAPGAAWVRTPTTWPAHPAAVILITPDPDQRWSILFDAGQAAAYMQLAAWEHGIGSCLATIYELDEARDLLGFPPDWVAHVAMSFGYPADSGGWSCTAQRRPQVDGGALPQRAVGAEGLIAARPPGTPLTRAAAAPPGSAPPASSRRVGMTTPRVVRAPRGTQLTCKSWLTEAAFRMLQNNLDPEVAERPQDLVVYGGRGQAARTWECFDAILESLRRAGRRRDAAGAVRQAGGGLQAPTRMRRAC